MTHLLDTTLQFSRCTNRRSNSGHGPWCVPIFLRPPCWNYQWWRPRDLSKNRASRERLHIFTLARTHLLSVSEKESPCLTFSCEPFSCSAQTRRGTPLSALCTSNIQSFLYDFKCIYYDITALYFHSSPSKEKVYVMKHSRLCHGIICSSYILINLTRK